MGGLLLGGWVSSWLAQPNFAGFSPEVFLLCEATWCEPVCRVAFYFFFSLVLFSLFTIPNNTVLLYLYLTSFNRKKMLLFFSSLFPCMVFFLFLQLCCAETHTFCVSINAQHGLDVPFLKNASRCRSAMDWLLQ